MMDAIIIEMMLKDKPPHQSKKDEEMFFARICIICLENKGKEYEDECVFGCKLGDDVRTCLFSDDNGYVKICSEYIHCTIRKTKHDPKEKTHGYCQDCLERRTKPL